MCREPVDTVGFAHLPAQIDAVVQRIEARDGERLGYVAIGYR
jgi:hypothetical protein